MKKNDVIQSFNEACLGLVAFMDYHLEEEFPKNETTVTIPFLETQMPNIDDVWWDDANIMAAKSIYAPMPNFIKQPILSMGETLLGQNPKQLAQFESLKKKLKDKEELIFLTPHKIIYDGGFNNTVGFDELYQTCDNHIGNIEMSPWLVTNPGTDNLNSAFMLAVWMHSTDGESLHDKIERARDEGLFKNIRNKYGLN